MKRFWHTCLAMIASATMTAGVANAQNDWNVPSEIGSYQSILSRAGYGNGAPPTAGRSVGGSGSANVNGGAINGGPINGGVVNNGGFGGGSSTRSGGFNNGFVGGGAVIDGGMTNGSNPINGGGFVSGEVVSGGSGSVGMPYNGSAASGMGQPVMGQPSGQPIFSQPQMAGSVIQGGASCGGGGVIADGGFGGTIVDGGYGGYVDNGIGYSDPAYDSQVFSGGGSVGQVFNGGGRRRGGNANWIVGIFAASFARDYEDGVLLSQNPRGDRLFTDDADEGDFGGYGVTLSRRQCNGKGLELRYWAFNTAASARLDGAAVSAQLPTLANLRHQPSARDVLSIYDSAVAHVVDRETDINNFEVNLLNNGGFYQTRRGRSAHFELVGGLRWFQFDERLAFTAIGDTAVFPLATESFTYQSQVNNDLLGFQLGARNELCFTNRIRGFFGVTAGIFNNHVQTQQNFFDANGVGADLTDGPSAGRTYDYSDSKNDVAILGELDAGITYQVSQRARARIGYRTFGVAGVALAADQIPVDFRRTDRVQRANSNGSLLLHGGYAGMEFCF